MMEILFRGKRCDNKEWIEGFFVLDDTDFTQHRIITNIDYSTGTFCNTQAPRVIPETVGQFTGMYDDNGNRIFDGDILKTTNSNCEIWFVDYKLTSFCANQSNANYSCMLEEFIEFSKVEVIGNIFDNHELLEKDK